MKKTLTLITAILFLASAPAHAFIGHSKAYKVESNFGIVGSCEMVVFPTAFQFETKEAGFYVPFSAIDFTRMEGKTITISVRGKLITIELSNPMYAKSLYHDLTHAIAGDYLDKD